MNQQSSSFGLETLPDKPKPYALRKFQTEDLEKTLVWLSSALRRVWWKPHIVVLILKTRYHINRELKERALGRIYA